MGGERSPPPQEIQGGVCGGQSLFHHAMGASGGGEGYTLSYVKTVVNAKSIQKRLFAIIKRLPSRKHITTVRTPRNVRQSLDDKVSECSRLLSVDGERYSCQLCHSSFKRSDECFQDCISGICAHSHFKHSRPSHIYITTSM